MALIQCPDCGSNVSSEAAACPNCARPIKAASIAAASPPIAQKTSKPPKKGLSVGQVIVGLFMGIVVIGWLASQSDKAPSQSPQQSAAYSNPVGHAADLPVFQTTPAQLYKLYEANEVAADNQLAGHTIQMTGQVKEIRKDITDSAVLVFDTGVMFSDAQAELEDSQKARASSLRAGQKVTVECGKAMRVMSSPMLRKCTIIDPA